MPRQLCSAVSSERRKSRGLSCCITRALWIGTKVSRCGDVVSTVPLSGHEKETKVCVWHTGQPRSGGEEGGGFLLGCFGAEPIEVTYCFTIFPLPEVKSPRAGRTWRRVM